MNRPELLILVPCHGLEDFPADLGESEATGLLNAFATAYHPALIAVTREIPGWRRADDPPGDPAGKIIIVPSACSSWLPHAWAQNATDSGAAVIEGIDDRDRLVEKLLAALHTIQSRDPSRGREPSGPDLEREEHAALPAHDPGADAPGSTIDPELVADFLAFGTAYLQLDLLTRRMHYYSNLDSSPLRLDLLGAADAAVAGDGDEARRKLKRAFELLLDARERFFPVDSYLIDLCLLIPRLAEKLPTTLSATEPTTLLATAADWEQIATEQPELVERLKVDVQGNRVGIAGGEYREGPTAIAPIESVLWEFDRGLAVYRKLFGRTPKVWGRRRYGFSTLIPQILERSNIPYAIHSALDDGYYPDDEQSKFRWEGCDGVGVDAFSRIPLAADGATSFLRFSQRVAEAMEGDQSAAIMFARWPELSTPWFEDLRRIHRYAPVFGKFVTLEGFFQETSPPSRTQKHSAKEYFAPYLTQAVAREQSDPIARFGGAVARRHTFDATMWMRSLAGLLEVVSKRREGEAPAEPHVKVGAESTVAAQRELRPPVPPDLSKPLPGGLFEPGPLVADEDFAERAPADADADLISVTDRDVTDSYRSAAKSLAEVVLAGAPAARGAMVINPLSFPRRVTVELPEGFMPPKTDGPVKHVLFKGKRRAATLDLPAAGFHWLPASSPPSTAKAEPPTADGTLLRNEFFEVHLSDATGGIAYVKGYGRSPKRLSQQLAYRFPRKRQIGKDQWGDDTSYYSEMRGRSIELTCTGPSLAEAVTTGDIIDQTNGDVLSRFKQSIRVWRGRPHIELTIELEPNRLPEGDPWSNHYACRFAWNDETAVLTRGVQQTAQPTPDSRFDAPHYVEIAEGDLRTTIVPIELPFHRMTGGRMLDTLLVVAGEARRTFRFLIACDEPYPLRPALDAYCPPIVVETEHGPPLAGPSGWFLHVDAKNVQITSVRPIAATEGSEGGLRLRLLETEGRGKTVRLSCFKTPKSAQRVNLLGELIEPLPVTGDVVTVEMRKYEITTVELSF